MAEKHKINHLLVKLYNMVTLKKIIKADRGNFYVDFWVTLINKIIEWIVQMQAMV